MAPHIYVLRSKRNPEMHKIGFCAGTRRGLLNGHDTIPDIEIEAFYPVDDHEVELWRLDHGLRKHRTPNKGDFYRWYCCSWEKIASLVEGNYEL